MRYRVLGPLEVTDDARGRLDLGPPRQRAVLAILVLNANRVVSLDRLIDELWGDTPPAAATSSLQAYISNLRRVLEPDRAPRTPASVLVSQPPGYVLRCEADDVDAIAFARRSAGARDAIAVDPFAARAELEAALAMWTGPALCDFAGEPFAAADTARLEELRAAVEEDLVDALLACGEVAVAVARLQRMIPAAPLRERRRAQEMIALYRSGRQADALRAYDVVRELLAEELGIDPSPALQQLQREILDQTLEASHRRPRPTPQPASQPELLLEPEAIEVPPFVGRDAQLAQLLAVLDEAKRGMTRVAVLMGEAGIGKTRLAEEVVSRARAAGWFVAWGRGQDDEGAPPLWPWMQILRALNDAGVVTLTSDERDDLSALVPELGGQPRAGDDDLDAARFRQGDAVLRVVERAATARPVLLVLDDMHWADASSLRLLRFLATYSTGARLALLVTAREREGPRAEQLRQAIGDLTRQTGTTRLILEPLTSGDVEEYVAAAAHTVSSDVAGDLFARSDGNPFFVCELLKLLDSESARGGGTEIPASVGDVIRRRLSRLPDDTRSLLQVASIGGRTFDLPSVAAAQQLAIDDALDLLEPASLTGIVREGDDGRFQFSHALVSDAIEADLSPMRRARLHLRLAQATIAEHGGDDSFLSEIGLHFEHAGTLAPAADVIAYARREAATATQRLAFEAAVVASQRVVTAIQRIDSTDEERLTALLDLAVARLRAGDLAGARSMQPQMFEIAERIGDVEVLARCALAFDSPAGAQWRSFGVVSWPVVDALEQALATLPPGDSVLRSRALSALGVELYYDDERRVEAAQLARDGAAMAERLGDAALLANALNSLIVAGKLPGRHEEHLAAARRIVELEGKGAAPDVVSAGRIHELQFSLRAGEITDFAAETAVRVAEAERRRDPTARTRLAWAEATASFFAGDLDGAEVHAKDAAARHERTGAWGSIEAYALHMELIRREHGRLGEMQAALEALLPEMVPPGMALLKALCAVGNGDLDFARKCLPAEPHDVPLDYAWLPYSAALARVAVALGHPVVPSLYDALLPYRAEIVVLDGSFVCYGSVEYYLGLLAEHLGRREADAHLVTAMTRHDHINAIPWSAHARIALARVTGNGALLDEAATLVAPTQLVVLQRELAELPR